MSARRRPLVFGALGIIAVAALCEALASAALSVLEKRLPFPDPRLYLAGPVSVERLARNFDPELGWTTPYDTPFGERPRAVDYGRPLVSAFGDSFTHGDEVNASDTWEEALARVLLRACHAGVSASFLGQAIELPALRRKLQKTLGQTGYPQLMLRMGYGAEAEATPRRPVRDVLRRTLA